MDAILNHAIEAIGLASSAGLPVSELWEHLSEASASIGATTLPPTLRRALWQMLCKRQADIQLGIPLPDNPEEGQAAGAKKKKNAAPEPKFQDVPWDSAEAATYTAAEAAEVRLIASKVLQDASLGVYAARLSRFQFSVDQRRTLRVLGEKKQRGALQSILTHSLGIEPRNYSYVVKNLEERGLVTKCPTVLQKAGASVLTTNLLMLSKFAAPEMSKASTRITDGRSVGHLSGSETAVLKNARTDGFEYGKEDIDIFGDEDDDEDDDVDGSEAGAANALHMVTDDDSKLRRITGYLAQLPNKEMNETELKRNLGYIGTPGHRRWRRIRAILEKRGCIDRYKARVGQMDGPVVIVVKLLKPWMGMQEDDEWTLLNLLDPVTMKLNTIGEQVAELSLDRQIIALLARAGGEGVTSLTVDTNLRFNVKRNEPRFKELKARFDSSLLEGYVNDGKMRLLKYTAADDLLPQLDQALVGLRRDGGADPPPGGYVAAMVDASNAILNEDGTNPLDKYKEEEEEGAAGAEVEAAAAAAAEDQGEIQVEEDEEEAPAGAEDVEMAEADEEEAAPEDAAAVANKKTSEAMRRLMADAGGDRDPSSNAASGAEDSSGPSKAFVRSTRKKPAPTELAELRRKWLVQKVNDDGLLLTAEMGAYLQWKDRVTRNNPKAVRPDKKVNQRIIDAAVEANELVVLTVNFPAKHGSLTSRSHVVLAKPGTEHTPEFVDKVFAAQRDMNKRIIALTQQNAPPSTAAEVNIDNLPVVDVAFDKYGVRKAVTGADGTGEGEGGAGAGSVHVARDQNWKRMLENGLSPSRMQRARILLEGMWEACAQRGDTRSRFMTPEMLDAISQGHVNLVSHAPADPRSGRQFMLEKFEGTEEQQRVVLTTDEIWKGLRVQHLVESLGSRTADVAMLQSYRRENKRLGELKRKELIPLCGGIDFLRTIKNTLTKMIDMLHRMGLISAIVPIGGAGTIDGGSDHVSHTGGMSAFLLKTTAVYEEPIEDKTPTPAPITPVAGPVGPTSPAAGPTSPGAAAATAAAAAPEIRYTKKLHTFDNMQEASGRNAYWLSMQFMVMCSPLAGCLSSRTSDQEKPPGLANCFPFNKAPEADNPRGWVGKAISSTEQVNIVTERLGSGLGARGSIIVGMGNQEEVPVGIPGAADVRASMSEGSTVEVMTWKKAADLAEELNVPFEAVARAVNKVQNASETAMRRRLGGLLSGERLGSRPGRRAAQRRRSSRRKRRRRESSEELDSDDEDEVDDTLAGLELGAEEYQGNRVAPQRKKKWYVEEDRELLQAWARVLAESGPDKSIRWKFIKDRPKNVLVTSCKYRINELKKNKETEAMMSEILNAACGVYSRGLEKKEAAAKEKEEAAAAAAAAEAEEAPAVVGEKRPLPADAAEESPSPTKKARADGEPPAAEEQQHLEGEEEDEEEASLVDPSWPRLWSLADAAERQALQTVVENIEKLVAVAPKRHKKSRAESFETGADKKTKGVIGKLSGRLLGPGSKGRLFVHRHFSAFKQWAKAAAAARGSAIPPDPSVAVAMEIVKSLLLTVQTGDKVDETFHTALTDRFSASDIRLAVAELHRLGHVTVARAPEKGAEQPADKATGGAASGLGLSIRFKAEMQPVFMDGSLFEDVPAAQADLLQRNIPAVVKSSVRAILPPVEQHNSNDTVSGGLVAAVLSKSIVSSIFGEAQSAGNGAGPSSTAAAGGAPAIELSATLPRSIQVPSVTAQQETAANSENEDNGGSTVSGGGMVQVLDNIKVAVTLPQEQHAGGDAPPETVPKSPDPKTVAVAVGDASSGEQILHFAAQEEVLFQPSLVAVDSAVRAKATSACVKLFTTKKLGSGKETAHRLLRALDEANSRGLSVQQCASIAGNALASSAKLQEALSALCRFGLARRVCVYDEVRLMSAAASQQGMAFPPPATEKKNLKDAIKAALAPLSLPSQGTPQPCVDVPIRPWVNHHGQFRSSLWAAVVRRAVGTIMQYPGVAGDVVLQSMRVINPQHGREVLRVLCESGVVHAKKVAKKEKPVVNVLAACFGTGGAAENEMGEEQDDGGAKYGAVAFPTKSADEEDAEWCFFADPVRCWEAEQIIPNQVLMASGIAATPAGQA